MEQATLQGFDLDSRMNPLKEGKDDINHMGVKLLINFFNNFD